eukprot:CAMPEP_0183556628 /NCGR_PEP_ID=MMETSP0371-20130417/83120_1 /TAXON_ID=268820 /ORGANISM="Peridinium aciculiferum, Strain PAER-2" /LENGTH=148 /DNA_ID=CAMNT_0025763281 /DNA_START=108 /DNA_END=554 /DNA_ORIENTATION=-
MALFPHPPPRMMSQAVSGSDGGGFGFLGPDTARAMREAIVQRAQEDVADMLEARKRRLLAPMAQDVERTSAWAEAQERRLGELYKHCAELMKAAKAEMEDAERRHQALAEAWAEEQEVTAWKAEQLRAAQREEWSAFTAAVAAASPQH